MNPKKVNWLFFTILVFEAAVTGILLATGGAIRLSVIGSLLLSQLLIFLPAAGFLLFTCTKPSQLIAFGRPKLSVSLLVIVITYLCMPLIIAVNAFSMLFVENEASNLQGLLAGVPGWLILLVVGILGPVCEELVFRGVIYHGYRRSGRIMAAAFLSAFLFGLTHLNFNQMSYAVLVGVIGVMLMEGTGSIFYSILFHVCINATNVLEMLIAGDSAQMTQQQREALVVETMHMPYKQALCVTIAVYVVIACVTTSIAGCIYYLILKKENRVEHMLIIWKGQKGKIGGDKRKLISWPLIISIVLCLAYMTYSAVTT